jgi:lysophospholipase L1-like esterase
MRQRVRARRPIILLILALTGIAGLVAPPAQAATSSAISYAALGDSYSSGVGGGDEEPASGVCRRGANAYPALWAASRAPARFVFVACAGATTSTVLSTQLGVLNRSTTLVTITVGGNDVGFAPVVGTCLVGSTATCAAAVSAAKTVARTVLPAQLAVTYAAIRLRTPHARLVVLGYPRLFETGAACGPTGMSQPNRIAVNGGADVLNSVVRSRARALGATFVDVRSRFAGHGICGSDPWINDAAPDVANAFHPNAAGYSQGYLPALESVTG